MSNDSNRGGGSDLDIFEGLGKKSEKPAAAPPPPPGSSSHLPAARMSPIDARKTLLGIPGPASASTSTTSSGHSSASMPASKPPPPSGSMRAATASNPPPPPGRGSLPNLGQPRRSRPPAEPPASANAAATERVPTVPPPISTRPGVRPASSPPSSSAQPAATKSANGKLEMDWDDDNEATHVYEKEKTEKEKAQAKAKEEKEKDTSADASSEVLRGPEESEPERASMDVIMSQPPRTSSQIPAAAPVQPPPAAPSASQDPDPASLSGAFSALGLKNGSAPPSSKVRSQPPASGSMRSVPPPPPTSQKGPSVTTQPMPPPPPPPPGQTTTAPMHMPVAQRQGSTPPTANTLQSAQTPVASAPPPAHTSTPPGAQASTPPPYNSAIPSAPPVPQLPPVSRAMEQTLLTRKEPSKAPLFGVLLVAVMAIAGLAVFFLMPRPGTLVINVSDTKGAAVSNLEISVDGTKRCESAPCIVRDISAGVHEVKVTAKGYEPPAPRAITIDKGRDVATDFQLVAAKTAVGTGFKVAAAHGTVKLSVDGKEVGVLPQEVRDLEPGEHKLRFVADRYVPLEKTISVGKDEIVDLGTVSLKVAKGKATIQLGTPGAKVYLVNGATRKEVPQFPMAIEFDPNEKWELLATKDGFEEFKEQISFDDGQAEKTFTVTLSPKGTATRATVAAAAAPAAPAPKAASAPVAAKEPSSDSPKQKPAAAAAGGGEAILKINSLPASSIVLDGKPIGVTPQTHVPVSPGTHTIMFVNAEQSLKKTITVEVKAGETKAAFAKLRD